MNPNIRARAGLVSFAIVVSAGCAAYPKTKPVTAYDLARGYRFETLASGRLDAQRPRPEDELFVVLAFSGGGTRAAALSYGVLDELRRVKIRVRNQERSLLDEVDVISSVSGGSFTAAYYGLRGQEIFNSASPFHTRFLKYPAQRDLFAHAVYRPQNWQHLRSRVEIAANQYARNIFAGETFAALEGRTRPYIVQCDGHVDRLPLRIHAGPVRSLMRRSEQVSDRASGGGLVRVPGPAQFHDDRQPQRRARLLRGPGHRHRAERLGRQG
jgi:predicted acylesterase/phospholipase RssA